MRRMINFSNPWHLVPCTYSKKDPLDEVNVVIEISKGSKVKYELDKETGMLRVDRVLSSAVVYPHNYGFIPQSYCEDKDPMDALVICQENIIPLSIIRARPIGVMHMYDEGEKDDKIICVALNDPAFNCYYDISELPDHVAKEIKKFFSDYKDLEGKEVVAFDPQGKDEAMKVLCDSLKLYSEKFQGQL